MWSDVLFLSSSGHLEDSVRLYQEALNLARQAGDQEAVDQIQEGLKKVKKKRDQETKEEQEKATEDWHGLTAGLSMLRFWGEPSHKSSNAFVHQPQTRI